MYWTSYVPGDGSYGGSNYFGHSLEVEYGITGNYTIALYADFQHSAGNDFEYIRAKAVMMHYQFLDKNALPVDLGVYLEYKPPRRMDSVKSEEIELKLILEKDIKFHRITLNPTFEKKISGMEVSEGVEFAFNGGYAYTKSMVFQPRLEFYTKMGELYDLSPFNQQQNYIFPAFDLFFGKYGQFRWHAGVGIGLTGEAEDLVVKSILSWEFF